MTMKDDKEIIRFEDLFKEEIKERKSNKNPEQKKNYGYAIIIYLLIMYVFASIVYVVSMQVDDFLVTYNEEERILETLIYDVEGIGLIDISTYDEVYKLTYDPYVHVIEAPQIGFYIILNPSNAYIEDFFYDYDEIEDTYIFNISYVYQLFDGDERKSSWDNQGLPIHFYVGSMQELPPISIDVRMYEGSETVLSNFALSLINFVVYIALIPGVWYVLRKDILIDFETTKQMKKSIFPALGMGYLYIIFGNIIANFLSQILASSLDITQGEAVNQQVIIAALRSEGVILMMISAIIIGPIVEELIFRKALFGLITNDKIALFFSSFIFGAIHLIGETSIQSALVNGVPYFIMGFVFGYIYLKNDKNIWIPIIIHIISNLVSIIGILIFF